MLLNIDFEKAFDCIEWDFIYSAFVFPQEFKNIVKDLYNGISACVTINGSFSKFFNLYRDVRQGYAIESSSTPV